MIDGVLRHRNKINRGQHDKANVVLPIDQSNLISLVGKNGLQSSSVDQTVTDKKAELINQKTKEDTKVKKEKEPAAPKIERIMHNLELDAVIWDRDSHGLFDYDSKVLKETKLQMMGSA